jgi:hypothetical protein
MRSALSRPQTDPTPIFEFFRGAYATELLTAAVAHFHVFECFGAGPQTDDELRLNLGLDDRPFVVLITALHAMGLLSRDEKNCLFPTDLAQEHLVPELPFDVTGYVGLAAESPGVLEMVERLRSNRPAGAENPDTGVAFIFREGETSAMEQEATARFLTLSLAGRAKNVASSVATHAPLDDCKLLLDVGGGSGIYSIACLQKHPQLRAIVWDRPEVLKVAQEMAAKFAVGDRLICRAGDMFTDQIPENVDCMLLSNILHDWDVSECRALVSRCADALPNGGKLLVHDVFLNDELDGPLPIALYSAALFTLTEGRAYSAAEYRRWLTEAGLVTGEIVPTLVHCGLLPATKG